MSLAGGRPEPDDGAQPAAAPVPPARDTHAAYQQVVGLLRGSRRMVALTGAGLSTDSGIPDYRGPQGVWVTDPEAARLVTLSDYVADPDVRRRAWLERRDHPAWRALPNQAHLALVRLERAGRLGTVITQNIDRLHQRAGSDPHLVVELHGNLFSVECLFCEDRTTMRSALDRVAAGESDPPCRKCGGILKSATISFGQSLEPGVLRRAVAAAAGCDLLLTVGTSLSVQPAAGLVDTAGDAGAKVIVINASPTPYDAWADAVIRTPIGEVLPRLVESVLAGDRGGQDGSGTRINT